MHIFGFLFFWEKLSEKIQNGHFWQFQICTSLFGKNCQKKFRTAIFGHSKFVPVFLGKIVRRNSEWPFLAIPNLYQSFWEKLSEEIQNGHFWPLQFCTSIFGKNCQKKFRMAIFGHSKFIPVILGKIVRRNSEWPFLAIPNFYQSFWEKLSEKIQNGHSKFIPVFLGKIVRKKFRMAIFGHSKFIPVFWEKLSEEIQNGHFWPFQIYTSHFGKNCQKKFRMAISGHSKFIPVILGKIVRKKNWNGYFWPFEI